MMILIVIAYFIIGAFFMGLSPDTSGRPFAGMLVLWPVFVPILAIFKVFDIAFRFGEYIKRKLR